MIIHLPSVDSTSTLAKQLLQDHVHVVVSADYQTAGRGRNGKRWEGATGENLYISFGYRHHQAFSSLFIPATMFYPALAVLDVVRTTSPGTSHRIKYPNDIQSSVDHRWAKISGILTENEFEGSQCVATTIGIGINVRQMVFPDTITQPCTSLLQQGANIPVTTVRELLIDAMVRYASLDHTALFAMWQQELGFAGKSVKVAGAEGDWLVAEIMADGRLLLEHFVSHEQRIIDNGDTIRYND